MTRGLRNNNPGNIRQSAVVYEGEIRPSQDKSFKQFKSVAYGYRAMFVILDSYKRRGYRTLRDMLNRYAPPVENYTDKYIDFVCKKAGVLPDNTIETLSATTMIPIISAMSQMENGVPAVYEDVMAGWTLYRMSR